jgi:hypothetical protein
MANNNDQKQKQQHRNTRDEIKHLLSGLGLGGDFIHLIDQAIRGNWTPTEFTEGLKNSNRFQKMFPGLVEKGGTINPFLGNTLGQAVGAYRKLAFTYQQSARGLFPVDDKTVGIAIAHGISPDEFAARIQAVANVKANPGLMDDFNQQLKAIGMNPVDEMGFLKFAAGAAARTFYDVYEAAQLRAAGLNISAKEAQGVAQTLGTPGQGTDIAALIAQVRQIKPDIGPELTRAGITDADLVQLESGVDPRGLAPTLQGIVANRRALGTRVVGSQPSAGPAGGLALYPEEGQGSDTGFSA